MKFKKLNIHYKLFKNESFEILEEPNGDCYIHDLVDDRYFVKEKSNILAYSNNKEIKDVYWSKIDTIYVILIIFSIVQLLVILNYLFSEQLAVDNEVGYSLVFLIFNVVFHELGHNISLRIFKKRPGKYKLHFFFIFLGSISPPKISKSLIGLLPGDKMKNNGTSGFESIYDCNNESLNVLADKNSSP